VIVRMAGLPGSKTSPKCRFTPAGSCCVERQCGLETRRPAVHIQGGMATGWKFLGEFRRGRKASLTLECIVAVSGRTEAEEIARKMLVGAETITAVKLSQAELDALELKEGDVRL
jgi:hypothetical protein